MKQNEQQRNVKDLKKENNISNGLSKFYWYIFFICLNGYILIKFSAFSATKLFLMLNHTKPHVEKNALQRCWTSRAGALTWRETAEWEWAVAYAENLHGGDFTPWRMVVISVWCALFVTSLCDVVFMFPNQHFREICWHNIRVLLRKMLGTRFLWL